MSKALMHSCINRPDLPCPGCEADCVEDSKAESKDCGRCGDPLDKNGSCPLCEQERLEEVRSGNWFGITCAIMLLCIPAFGQAAGRVPGYTRDRRCMARWLERLRSMLLCRKYGWTTTNLNVGTVHICRAGRDRLG